MVQISYSHTFLRGIWVSSAHFPQCSPTGTVLASNLQNSVTVLFYKQYGNISPRVIYVILCLCRKKNLQLVNLTLVIPYVVGRNIF